MLFCFRIFRLSSVCPRVLEGYVFNVFIFRAVFSMSPHTTRTPLGRTRRASTLKDVASQCRLQADKTFGVALVSSGVVVDDAIVLSPALRRLFEFARSPPPSKFCKRTFSRKIKNHFIVYKCIFYYIIHVWLASVTICSHRNTLA